MPASFVQVNTKMSELRTALYSELDNEDLFFSSTIRYVDDEKESVEYAFPYESYANTLSAMFGSILHRPRTVTKQWIFDSKEYPPLQTTRMNAETFFNQYIIDSNNRKDIITLNGNGNYSNNNNFFPRNLDSTMLDAEDISQYSIANLDYVNRMAALLYDYWIDLLKNFSDTIAHSGMVQSAVGMFVYSTTLSKSDSSNSNSNIRKFYGMGQKLCEIGDKIYYAPNTSWLQHKGKYFLIAANNNDIVEFNKAEATKNNPVDITINKDYISPHTHKIDSHSHTVNVSGSASNQSLQVGTWPGSGVSKKIKTHSREDAHGVRSGSVTITGTSVSYSASGDVGGSDNSTIHTSGEDWSLNIEQSFKEVYVWERIN